AGTKRSAGTKRTGSTGRRRSGGTARSQGDSYGSEEEAAVSEKVLDACPIGKVVRKSVGEDGQYEYSRSKTAACRAPDNTEDASWSAAMQAEYPRPSWIDAAEAAVFSCSGGYVLQGSACVDSTTICPIDETLAKTTSVPAVSTTAGSGAKKTAAKIAAEQEAGKATVLRSLSTGLACSPSKLAVLTAIAGESGAVKLVCPANTYSDVVAGAGEGHLRCVGCPAGTTSTRGSFSAASCRKSCSAGKGVDRENPEADCLDCAEGEVVNANTGFCSVAEALLPCASRNRFLNLLEARACIGDNGRSDGGHWTVVDDAGSAAAGGTKTGTVGQGLYKIEGWYGADDCNAQVFGVNGQTGYSLTINSDTASITVGDKVMGMSNGGKDINVPGMSSCADFGKAQRGPVLYKYKP
ncbi:MAG: hypothetical protein LBT92_01665, partial [Rickettsiales bacterium]|nr:hypothetical protein [Rickettsiales bacterium]